MPLLRACAFAPGSDVSQAIGGGGGSGFPVDVDVDVDVDVACSSPAALEGGGEKVGVIVTVGAVSPGAGAEEHASALRESVRSAEA